MAAAAVAEQAQTDWEPKLVEQPPELPLVINVTEMTQDELVRARAGRLINSIGGMAVGSEVEASLGATEEITSLMDALHRAAKGDMVARQLVQSNVRTDVIERTIKSGHLTQVQVDIDQNGKILQHGQYMESIQANTLKHASAMPAMRRRAEAETRNAYRIENLHRMGLLGDYYFVVFSRVIDTKDPGQIRDAGFFEETMSMSLQATTVDAGALTTESAFLEGVNAQGERNDRQTVKTIGDILGVDLDKDDVAAIDTPALIHKSLMPNGVVDLVWLADSINGKSKTSEYYLSFRESCAEREKSYESKVTQIVEDLLREATFITTPEMAVRRLDKLSGKHMVAKAAEDTSINPRVFGTSAAWHIEHARWLREQGNTTGADRQVAIAASKETSFSCPSGSGGRNTEGSDANLEGAAKNNPSDDCEFVSKECPKCHKKNIKTVVKKGRYYGACGCKS